MTLPDYALDYSSCTVRELVRFIKNRTGQKVRRSQAKSVYTSILQEADRDATFRFMDLPPEVRNLVYRELLPSELLPSDRARAQRFPRILGVSKLVHQEAEGILYSTFTMPIKLGCTSARRWFWEVGRQRQQVKSALTSLRDINWPTWMSKFKSVKIDFSLITPSVQCRIPLSANRQLYSLVSYLLEPKHLKVATEVRVMYDWMPEETLTDILSPLAKLGAIVQTFKDVPDEVVAALRAQTLEYEAKKDPLTLSECCSLLAYVEVVLQAAVACGIPDQERKMLEYKTWQLRCSLDKQVVMDAWRDRLIREAARDLEEELGHWRARVQRLVEALQGKVVVLRRLAQQLEDEKRWA